MFIPVNSVVKYITLLTQTLLKDDLARLWNTAADFRKQTETQTVSVSHIETRMSPILYHVTYQS